MSDGVRRLAGLHVAVVSAVVAGALVLTGCGLHRGADDEEKDDGMSLQRAKAETMDVEREIAEALDPDRVVDTQQADEGALLSCADDRYQWTGRVKIELDGAATNEDVLKVLESYFTDRDGYVAQRRDVAGSAGLLVSGPDGSAFVGSYDEEVRLVNVASASRCFVLADDESPLSTY